MRIAQLTPHALEADLVQPFARSFSSTAKRSACLVEIVGEDGTAGWGECFARACRAAVGPGVALMLDADPGHDAVEAVALGRSLADCEADAGMVAVPERVGLGIAIDRGALERFRKTPDRC